MPALALAAVALLGLGFGAVIWFVLRHRQALEGKEPAKETTDTLTFQWRYIVLPLSILLISILLSAWFYPHLPTKLAYHFTSDGSPDRWLSREAIIVWMLTPQVFLTLAAAAITWLVTRLSRLFRQAGSNWGKAEGIISLMGNMVALPQTILGFAMLDIFSYNSYQVHLMPLWLSALIVMLVGGIIIGIFFIRALRQTWRASKYRPSKGLKER